MLSIENTDVTQRKTFVQVIMRPEISRSRALTPATDAEKHNALSHLTTSTARHLPTSTSPLHPAITPSPLQLGSLLAIST